MLKRFFVMAASLLFIATLYFLYVAFIAYRHNLLLSQLMMLTYGSITLGCSNFLSMAAWAIHHAEKDNADKAG